MAGGSNVVAIINPNNGPDWTGSDTTVKCLPFLTKAKVTSIGYVATGFGSRSPDDIKADITQWAEVYQDAGLSGIFFDEGSSWCACLLAVRKHLGLASQPAICRSHVAKGPPRLLWGGRDAALSVLMTLCSELLKMLRHG